MHVIIINIYVSYIYYFYYVTEKISNLKNNDKLENIHDDYTD